MQKTMTIRDKVLQIIPSVQTDGAIWQEIHTWGGSIILADDVVWDDNKTMIEQEFRNGWETFFDVVEIDGKTRLFGTIPF